MGMEPIQVEAAIKFAVDRLGMMRGELDQIARRLGELENHEADALLTGLDEALFMCDMLVSIRNSLDRLHQRYAHQQ